MTEWRSIVDRRSSLKLIGGTVATAIVGSRIAMSTARPDVRPNIILILVDDLRCDEFGAAGHPYLKTPHIDRLARRRHSMRFHSVPQIALAFSRGNTWLATPL